MRKILIAAAFALVGLLATAPAQAHQCAPGFTHGFLAACHPIPSVRGYGYHPYAHPYAHAHHCWWRNGVRVCE